MAAVAVTAAAGQAFIGPALGLGALGVAGAGGFAAAMGILDPCPLSRPCRVRRTPQPRLGLSCSVFTEKRSLCPAEGHQRKEALSELTLNIEINVKYKLTVGSIGVSCPEVV